MMEFINKFIEKAIEIIKWIWIPVVLLLLVAVVIFLRNLNYEQYIIGDLVSINSATAKMDNFDKHDGAYTADGDKLYIRFETDNCKFYDVEGNEITALDFKAGSRVRMTSSSRLKTDKYGYTTVYINKVELLADPKTNASMKEDEENGLTTSYPTTTTTKKGEKPSTTTASSKTTSRTSASSTKTSTSTSGTKTTTSTTKSK